MSEWRDRHLGVSAISQKCVMSELIHGVSVASASAVHISKKVSNCESMVHFEKRGDSKPCRTAVTGAYPKDTHGQTHTLSFRKISIKESILLIFKKKAKVCATIRKQATYCPARWTRMKLARRHVRKYKYVQP